MRRAGPARARRWRILSAIICLLAAGGAVWVYRARTGPGAAEGNHEAAVHYRDQARDLVSQHRAGEAMELLEKAKQADPHWIPPYLIRASLFAGAERFTQALNEVKAARKIAPHDPVVILAALQYTPPHVPSAERESQAREAVALMPEAPDPYYRLGLAIAGSGDSRRLPEALKALQDANRLSPANPLYVIEMGKLYSRMKSDDRAAGMLESAWRLLDMHRRLGDVRPDEMETQRRNVAFWLWQIYRRLGRGKESRDMAAVSARLSAKLQAYQSLQSRAGSSPPDTAAVTQLQAISRQGYAYWEK